MKPHKHAELIKAWADGAEIESKRNDGTWVIVEPAWSKQCEYRIKPEPKEDQQMRIQFFNIVTNKFCDLYMMLDGETGVVKHMQTAEIKV